MATMELKIGLPFPMKFDMWRLDKMTCLDRRTFGLLQHWTGLCSFLPPSHFSPSFQLGVPTLDYRLQGTMFLSNCLLLLLLACSQAFDFRRATTPKDHLSYPSKRAISTLDTMCFFKRERSSFCVLWSPDPAMPNWICGFGLQRPTDSGNNLVSW